MSVVLWREGGKGADGRGCGWTREHEARVQYILRFIDSLVSCVKRSSVKFCIIVIFIKRGIMEIGAHGKRRRGRKERGQREIPYLDKPP
jgi:hypothetical protein